MKEAHFRPQTDHHLDQVRKQYIKARRVARSPFRSALQTGIHFVHTETPTAAERLTSSRTVYELVRASSLTTATNHAQTYFLNHGVNANPTETASMIETLERKKLIAKCKPSETLTKINSHTKIRLVLGVGLTAGIGLSAATGLLPVTGALLVARGGLQAYGLAGGIKEFEKKVKPVTPVDPKDNKALDEQLLSDRNAAFKRNTIALGIAAVSGSLSLAHHVPRTYTFTGQDKLYGKYSSLCGFAEGQYAQKITGQVLHPFDYLSERNYEMHLTKLFGTDWRHSMGYHNVIAGYVKHLQIMNHISGDLVSHTQPLVM